MTRLFLLFIAYMACNGIFAADIYPKDKRDSLLNIITGAERPEYKINLLDEGAKGNGIKDCKPAKVGQGNVKKG